MRLKLHQTKFNNIISRLNLNQHKDDLHKDFNKRSVNKYKLSKHQLTIVVQRFLRGEK